MAQTGGQRIATPSRTVSQFELRSRFERQFLTFAGKSSKDFLLYLFGPGVFNSPEPDVSATEVPGRNGDVLSENAKDGRRKPSQSSPGFFQLLAINACRTPTTRSSSGWQPVSRRLNLTCRITAGQRRGSWSLTASPSGRALRVRKENDWNMAVKEVKDKGASVLARLKKQSKETGLAYQMCLQLFAQEEFLRKLEKSRYDETLALKGGMFLYTLTNFEGRPTMDIDFMLRRLSNDLDSMSVVMKDICSVQTGNDFIAMEALGAERIAV